MKKYDEWNEIKKETECFKNKFIFKTREIYWVKVGQNIGFEVYGKGDEFLRPVLVFKTFGKNSFLGIPLTSVIRDDIFHYEFIPINKSKINCAILSQIKLFSSQRIKSKFGKMSQDNFYSLKEKLKKLIDL